MEGTSRCKMKTGVECLGMREQGSILCYDMILLRTVLRKLRKHPTPLMLVPTPLMLFVFNGVAKIPAYFKSNLTQDYNFFQILKQSSSQIIITM